MLGKRTKDKQHLSNMSECSQSEQSEFSDYQMDQKSNKSQKTEMKQVCVMLNSVVFDESDDENSIH